MKSFDCVIIGAGFTGLRALIETRSRGLSARVIEAGTDVGGTWYWNRYPGARTDSQSWVYNFRFDDGLLQDWSWPTTLSDQPTLERYFQHVADRFDLREDIDFNTRIEAISRDDENNQWILQAQNGATYACTWLLTAGGQLSETITDPFDGLADFAGECYYTSKWPKEDVNFAGKRVVVVGTGSTGIQVIPQISETADELIVLQRTPNYCIPARNTPFDATAEKAVKDNYADVWDRAFAQAFGFDMGSAGRTMADVDEAERNRILERGWERGGFEFLFEMFDDLLTNDETNQVVSEFIRSKIRAIVEDPELAETLCPQYPLGGKRPPLGTRYFETYNRDNVTLVDISENQIDRAIPTGIRLQDGTEIAADMIVVATGFDASTGPLTAMDFRGSHGRSLAEVWREGAGAYLGMFVDGFPNAFLLGGPGFPFGNTPTITDFTASWVGEVIDHMRTNDYRRVETTPDAIDGWVQLLWDIVNGTVMRTGDQTRAWYLGANVEGKAHAPLFYLAGVPGFFSELTSARDAGYRGLTFTSSEAQASATAS